MKNKWLAIMFSISLLGEIPIGVKAMEVADMVSPGFQEIGISYTAGRLHVSGGNGLLYLYTMWQASAFPVSE